MTRHFQKKICDERIEGQVSFDKFRKSPARFDELGGAELRQMVGEEMVGALDRLAGVPDQTLDEVEP
ncbi:MAG TPA: hypothetical protein VIJ42_09505 [Stellaceae bacterium]